MTKLSLITNYWIKVGMLTLVLAMFYSVLIKEVVRLADGFMIIAILSSFFVNLVSSTGQIASLNRIFIAFIAGIILFIFLYTLTGFIFLGLTATPNHLIENYLIINLMIPIIGMIWILIFD